MAGYPKKGYGMSLQLQPRGLVPAGTLQAKPSEVATLKATNPVDMTFAHTIFRFAHVYTYVWMLVYTWPYTHVYICRHIYIYIEVYVYSYSLSSEARRRGHEPAPEHRTESGWAASGAKEPSSP